jgi:hypothetical protein
VAFPPRPAHTETAAPLPTHTATATPLPVPTETPAPTKSPPTRFAVIGDYGQAGQPAADVAALVDSWQIDFVITVGDNNYPSGSADTIDENIGQYYQEYIFPYAGAYGEGAQANRFFPSLGNHDWMAPGAQPYLDYFTLPGNERYYNFTWGPVELFALDSDPNDPDGFRRDSVQAAWLQAGLAASQAPWKIIYFHAAPYSSGYQGSSVWMQWPFEAWGASAVLAGHDHIYERLQIGGIPYITNGIGGGAIYNIEDPVEGSLVRYNDDWGALLVEATAEAIGFQFITRGGEVVDMYSMEK